MQLNPQRRRRQPDARLTPPDTCPGGIWCRGKRCAGHPGRDVLRARMRTTDARMQTR